MNPGDLNGADTLAERRDEQLGVREQFRFVGPAGDRIAVMSHLPPGPSRATVIICSSILNDLTMNYRREVGLGRMLASRGITARRFHYRGTGNSDWTSSLTTYQSMCEDARIVADGLVAGDLVAFVGTRMGALVAAHAATSIPEAPLVLVEPVVSAADFYREGFRFRIMRDLKEQVTDKPSSARLLSELEEKGVLDIFGHHLDRSLYHSTQTLRLEHEMPADARPILLLQMGGAEIRSEYVRIADSRAERSPRLETVVEGKADVWWFLDDQNRAIESGLETVANWLQMTLGNLS